MQIRLTYLEDDGTDLMVGTMDGQPLWFRERQPFACGAPVKADEAFLSALQDAFDESASRVFGGDWSSPVAAATGLNRRTVTYDRIRKYGLPAWTLKAVGWASLQDSPRAFGHLVAAARRMDDDGVLPLGGPVPQTLPPPTTVPGSPFAERAEAALLLIRWMKSKRRLPQTRSDDAP